MGDPKDPIPKPDLSQPLKSELPDRVEELASWREPPPPPPLPDFPEPPTPKADQAWSKAPPATLYRIGGMGFEMLATIVVMGALGYAVDALTGSFPVGMAVGGGLGLIIGFVQLVRHALKLNR